MEGPTPVSALIHAATMVAAGVYMLVRVGFLIQASPTALVVIAWIGTITAVIAALMATQQNDIKRILAYSTLSQLGYMVMAVGLASGEAAMFHLFTHAFFKALLFLGAGAIIIMLHHEQNIWKMGGLADRMQITFLTFVVGTLALIGLSAVQRIFQQGRNPRARLRTQPGDFRARSFHRIPDRVLHDAARGRGVLRQTAKRCGQAGDEAPLVMTVPLVVLAIPVFLAGFGFLRSRFFTLPVKRSRRCCRSGARHYRARFWESGWPSVFIATARNRSDQRRDFAAPFLLR